MGAAATTLVCASCRKPVERCFDDDYQHTTTEADLACTAWPVVPARAETAKVFTWDYRGQPDMTAIAAAVTALSSGQVFMREIETGTDDYAWAVSGAELTDEQAYRLWSGEDGEAGQ